MGGASLHSVEGVVQEIMKTLRSLPQRPGIDEVDAAKALVGDADEEERARTDAVSAQRKGLEVPEELLLVLQRMQTGLASFQCREQKREALRLLDLESVHESFDELIQRALKCISLSSSGAAAKIPTSPSVVTVAASEAGFDSSSTVPLVPQFQKVGKNVENISKDDSFLIKAKPTMITDGISSTESSMSRGHLVSSAAKPAATSGEDNEKLSLIKLAGLIEVSLKKGTRHLNLQNMLMNQVDWLPDSLGKLSDLITLDLSENRIVALPITIGALSSLVKLDLHSNRIVELPESIGDLMSLLNLDLRGNQLTSLPSAIGKLVNLVELDLSSNHLSSLTDTIGNLSSLQKLNLETNDIDELPHSIGQCVSLVELRADYNHLKCLPEAVGRLGSLEVLSVRYNNIKGLPTTMASLSKLKELDVSFNELESVPESLCLVTTLVKLNLGNNFADLQSLPRSIGNLEMLEELDISNNQIRVLPDSFGMLTQLHILHIEENPLEMPPRRIAEMGAQAVVHYIAEHIVKRDIKSQSLKNKKTWAQFCLFSRSNKRKHDGLDYLKA